MATPTLTNFRWVFALVAALGVGAIVATVVPRYAESEAVSWIVAAVAALLTAALVYVWLRPRGEVTETRDRL